MRVDSIKIKPEYEKRVAPLQSSQLDALRASIKEHGIREPVVINVDNVLLDGHHRISIAQKLGIQDIPVRVQKFDDEFYELDEEEYVIEANFARRQLTDSQLLVYASELEEIEAKKAQLRMNAGGKISSEGSAAKIASDKSGVSEFKIKGFKRLKKDAAILDKPELVEAVVEGKATIDGSLKKAKKLKELQELEALKVSRKARANEDRAEAARSKFNSLKIDNQKIIDEINNRGAIKQSIEDEDGEMIVIGGDDDGNLKKGTMPSYMADADEIARIKSDIAVDEGVMREVDDDSDIIFNIGYQGRSISEFVEILLDNNIDALVDVRDSPRAMLNEAFNGSELEKHLKDVGIKYIGASEVGAAPEIRGPFQAGDVSFQAFKEYYRASINGKKSKGKLHKFAKKILPEGRVVLMCMESSPAECHRGILCKMLVAEKFYLRIKVL